MAKATKRVSTRRRPAPKKPSTKPKSKRTKDDALIAAAAASDFEPWIDKVPFPALRDTDASMHRVAYNLMFLAKADLAGKLEEMGDDLSRKLIVGLFDAAARLHALGGLLDAAHSRALIAACHSFEREGARS
jgi:hypothetical protein